MLDRYQDNVLRVDTYAVMENRQYGLTPHIIISSAMILMQDTFILPQSKLPI